ncbi:MAG: SUMF1/EgtB/PvdO family nonheme iron enzyme, partial [Planctomycetes bacterium]|nr:SUMF1/EgtB/PvdO family nonheme iron enzyme [Planctomycetota bacterium]
MRAVRVFVSYSQKDLASCDVLASHLRPLEREGRIQLFIDRTGLEAGDDFKTRILDELRRAEIIVVLFSARFFDSDWIHDHEIPLIADHSSLVIPVLLRPCRWKSSPLGHLLLHSETPASQDLEQHCFDLSEKIDQHAARLRQMSSIGHWRSHLRHVHQRSIPLFDSASAASLESRDLCDIVVEVEIGIDDTDRLRRATAEAVARGVSHLSESSARSTFTLRQLLEGSRSEDPASESKSNGDSRASRWLVRGAPGAGKSTVARFLTWELAGESDAPIPIFVSLQRWMAQEFDPFELAERELRSVHADEATGLAAKLRERARREGAVWLFLDGFDELDRDRVADARERIVSLSKSYAGLTLVVLTRPFVQLELPGFREALLRPLASERRPELVQRWLGPDLGATVWSRIDAHPVLRDDQISGNPLLLTLVTWLAREDGDLPANLLRLYERATDHLLRRGFGREPKPVADPDSALRLLSELALRLQSGASDAWERRELNEHLVQLTPKDSRLASHLEAWQGSRSQFLDDMKLNCGLLAQHDRPHEPWRFLHRTFGEYLAAEALVFRGDSAILEQVAQLDREALGRWGETLSMACACSSDPLPLLERIREFSPELTRRILPSVDRFAPEQALEFLVATEGWDHDDLQRLVRSWGVTTVADRERVTAILWPAIQERRTIRELGMLHYALCVFGPVDDAEFFADAGLAPREVPAIETVPIPAGTFVMGGDAYDDEKPRHEVTLGGFAMGKYPITNEEYQVFDPKHPSLMFAGVTADELRRHPVGRVSWWEAYLFCRW